MKAFHPEFKLSNKSKRMIDNTEIKHLNKEDHSLAIEVAAEDRKSIKSFLLSKRPYTSDCKEVQDRTEAVFNYIVKTRKPISTVDDIWFTKLLSTFDNRYRIPCRQTFTNTIIPEKFNQLKVEMRAALDKVNFASVTTDGWTSLGSNSYMSVTVHFVQNIP